MKATERAALARAIQRHLPEFARKGSLLALRPLGRVLRGILLDNVSDPGVCRVYAFIQPLYVRHDHIVLNFAREIPHGCRWAREQADELVPFIRSEAIPFIGPIDTPSALAEWAKVPSERSPLALEMRACSLIAAGRQAEGAVELRSLLRRTASDDRDWAIAKHARYKALLRLVEHDPLAADAQLLEWERHTFHSLGLSQLR